MRLLVVGALTVVMAGIAGGATAQDEELSLCEHFDIDAFAAAVGLEFETPPAIDRPDACIYDAKDAPEGLRSVDLGLGDLRFGTYDQRRAGAAAMETVDLTIADQPAHAFLDTIRGNNDERVVVDLEHAILFVSLTAEDGAVPDQRAHVIDLAETVVQNLGPIEPEPTAQPATEPPGIPVGASGVELPAVEGISWDEEIGVRGDQFGDHGVDAEFMDALLDEVGSDLSAVGLLVADARESSGKSAGNLTAVRIDGVDSATLEQAVPGWLAGLMGLDDLDTTTVGGKEVISLGDIGGGAPGYAYVSDDTVYLLGIDDELAGPVLEALP